MSDEPVVYVVDDDADARESVSALVESMGLRAEAFASAEDFLGRVNDSCQGCVVTDVRMLGINGLELQERLLGQEIPLPVIVITAHADVPLAVRAMQNGAVTLLEKPCREQELWDSIRTALTLDAESRSLFDLRRETQQRFSTLTNEEQRVMQLMVDGKLNKVIASQLDISTRTVELRWHNVLKKMGASSLAELVRMVVEAGK
tara:strand:- start:353 stop:961 length:609 start_codon:yes stop_codon:yes gene_type:complete